MKKRFVCDTHSDSLMRMIDLGYDLNDPRLQVSLPKMKDGHDLQVFACFVDPAIGKRRFVSRTLQMIDLLREEARKNRNQVALCRSFMEVTSAQKRNRKIALLGIEGGHAIANDLSVLRCYRELGVIYMTLTWSNTNDWADSSGDKERWGGLTQFGQEVVREMNRIGMMVDVSHVSDRTFWQTLRISAKPLIASHSSARALCRHPRNMTDRMIRAMAEKGGVVFINFFPCFIRYEFSMAYEQMRKRFRRKLKQFEAKCKRRPEMYTYAEEELLRGHSDLFPRVTMKDVVRHIEHVAAIAGVEAVGFGSDYDGIPFAPDDMPDCTALPRLCDALRHRGFKPSEIDKIAGGNFLRVFADCVG